MKKIIKNNKKVIKYGFLILLCSFMIFEVQQKCYKNWKANEIEYTDSNKTYHKQFNEGKFSDLKRENRELYDSLKKYKDKIDYLVQFKYDKSYNTEKVIIKTKEVKVPVYVKNGNGEFIEKIEEPKTFEYENGANDSIEYKLKINSTREPNWYSLNVKVHDKITMVNKDEGNGVNHLTINTDNQAQVSDVTTFKRKENKNIFNKIAIGPSVYYGYDIKNKQIGYGVGITVTYNIFGTK